LNQVEQDAAQALKISGGAACSSSHILHDGNPDASGYFHAFARKHGNFGRQRNAARTVTPHHLAYASRVGSAHAIAVSYRI
jgi:hypothetical protein